MSAITAPRSSASSNNSGREIEKSLFLAVLDGLVTAETIETKQILFENFFTVVKVAGNRVTLQLHEAFGGATFDLESHWETFSAPEMYEVQAEVWQQMPADVLARISSFIAQNMPGGSSMDCLVCPDKLRSMIDAARSTSDFAIDHCGQKIAIAGKVFRLDGFFLALATNAAFKLLYRAVRAPHTLSIANVRRDCAKGLAACSAAWLSGTALAFVFWNPPLSLCFAVKAVAAIMTAESIGRVLGEEESL